VARANRFEIVDAQPQVGPEVDRDDVINSRRATDEPMTGAFSAQGVDLQERRSELLPLCVVSALACRWPGVDALAHLASALLAIGELATAGTETGSAWHVFVFRSL
jgi:hypothetical protein